MCTEKTSGYLGNVVLTLQQVILATLPSENGGVFHPMKLMDGLVD